jgi:hypothetical protein
MANQQEESEEEESGLSVEVLVLCTQWPMPASAFGIAADSAANSDMAASAVGMESDSAADGDVEVFVLRNGRW